MKEDFSVTYTVPIPADSNVREIICFNNFTLLLALNTKNVISVQQKYEKNGFEYKIKHLPFSIKNMVAVDNCIIA